MSDRTPELQSTTSVPSRTASNLVSSASKSPSSATDEHPTPDGGQALMPLRSKPRRIEELSEERRPSIQFCVREAETNLKVDAPKLPRPKLSQRLSSPPPPSTYESRVSFDTFDNRDATDFSFSLRNDYSEFALEWLLDELVDDGDEVVCLRVVDKDSKFNTDSSLEEQRYRKEAHKLMQQIQAKTKEDNKSISLTLEFAVGKVQDTIQHMIAVYEPACLIVGTRGRSLNGIQGLLPGSVSKYCLQNSPVPVIVVRPSSKREKKKQKRRADPTRRSYMDILERSGAQGGQALNKVELDKYVGPMLASATLQEAEAVAKAIGISDSAEHVKYLSNVYNGFEAPSSPESPSPGAGTSPNADSEASPSPDLGRLDTSDVSENEDLNAEEATGMSPLGRASPRSEQTANRTSLL